MNKAAFLNIIRQVAPIQDQEVEDLEELVASFPYCQTAHILLAKAAYDRGSMLSTQKMRRAAAHASNRQLLKRIVYAPPILHNAVDQEVLEEEAPAVFAPIPGNEAKNAFPEVAPEESILQALENISEEDLLDVETDVPDEIEEPEEESIEEQPIEEPATEDEAEIEEPSQPVDATQILGETISEPQLQVVENPLEDSAPEEEFIAESELEQEASYDLLDEQDSAFIENFILEEDQASEEESEEIQPELKEEESVSVPIDIEKFATEALDVEDATIEGESSLNDELNYSTFEEDNEAPSLDFAEDTTEEAELAAISLDEEEPTHLTSLSSIEDQPVDAEIEADFITNAVQGLTSHKTANEQPVEEILLTEEPALESIIAAELLSEPVSEQETIAEDSLELLPNEVEIEGLINADTQAIDVSKEEPEVDALPSSEEDELFSLMQIDGLATLSAPIPSVNLSHAEIISELTSRPEPIEFMPEEAVLQEEAVTAAIIEEAPLVVNTELAEFVAELQGRPVVDNHALEGEQTSYPMLQMAPVAAATSEVETEKDPYLSIFYHNSLAYRMDSSRMGETIQLRDDLTTSKPYYFQPDLILEHVKGNGAMEQVVKPVAKLDVQLSIIDQFLKSNPKLKSMAHSQQKNEPQEDLSAKSSKIKKNLASENLALIFIKQGKFKKALKIYEQLIMKFPEKKSYFAEQIEKLRNEL
ncbi:hypothetical protein [Rufibacter sp. DG15C]|uniref:hypothetical protein n=1 Tax=Rufibacter sp. DG15C TaxID=1379909 RepID=UPI0008356679|nr:hypothetical protein [Rufibacter sp. DG15C]